jgi:cell shape-determining protein MreC
MDGVYPAGLPIGTVSKVAVETGTLLQNVEVKVGVDLGRLEQVLVVASGHKQSGKAAEAKKLSKDAVVRGARQR